MLFHLNTVHNLLIVNLIMVLTILITTMAQVRLGYLDIVRMLRSIFTTMVGSKAAFYGSFFGLLSFAIYW